jgi:hypothetical protein
LRYCSGAPIQVANAIASQHAVAMGQIQTQGGTAFATAGAAPAFTLTPSPAISAYAANQRFRVGFGAAGTTGSNTLNISGLGAKSLMQYDGAGTLVPAVVTSGLLSDVEYNGTYMVLLDPVAPKTAVVGSARNVKASLTSAATSVSFTADEIVVETALGGAAYQLASFSKTFSGGTVGAGGMDTGSLPTSGYVAIYAIYNPTTNTSTLLGMNATSAAAGNVYSGSNMPSGYTASALISVWPTNASGQLIPALQSDRQIAIASVQALSVTTVQTIASLSIASIVPPNARSVTGSLQVGSTSNGAASITLFSSAAGVGGLSALVSGAVSSGFTISTPFSSLLLSVIQTLYYSTANTATSFSAIIYISNYTI